MMFNFANSEYFDEGALLQKIASEPLELAPLTRTDLALRMANDDLFTAEGRDRPDKPNILIVLTDDRPKLPGGVEVDFNVFKDLSEKIKAKGVLTVAVGIGKRIRQDVLQMIAGVGNPVVQVEEFSELQGEIDRIKLSACSESIR